jgi:hypothetical protein
MFFFTCQVPRKSKSVVSQLTQARYILPVTQVGRSLACSLLVSLLYVCMYGVRMNEETRHDVHNLTYLPYIRMRHMYVFRFPSTSYCENRILYRPGQAKPSRCPMFIVTAQPTLAEEKRGEKEARLEAERRQTPEPLDFSRCRFPVRKDVCTQAGTVALHATNAVVFFFTRGVLPFDRVIR